MDVKINRHGHHGNEQRRHDAMKGAPGLISDAPQDGAVEFGRIFDSHAGVQGI
jgi:hypothetical protein